MIDIRYSNLLGSRPPAGSMHAPVRMGRKGRHVAREHGNTLARDGLATLEWIERYLERVRELPVLAQVEPGEIRARLPAHPPDEGEPFANLLRDLDDVLLPGLTHWQSPRFFAYFATCASEPAILAELLVAGLNNVGILWRTSPALQELEEVTLAWLAELLGLPAGWHGQIEDGASISTIAALAAARHARPDADVVVCSEHAHSSVDKACRLLGLEVRKTPADEAFRLRPDALDLAGACAVVATVGTTSSTSVDPVVRSRTPARSTASGCTSTRRTPAPR